MLLLNYILNYIEYAMCYYFLYKTYSLFFMILQVLFFGLFCSMTLYNVSRPIVSGVGMYDSGSSRQLNSA